MCARGTLGLPQPYGGAYTIWAIYARRFDNRPAKVPRSLAHTLGNSEETWRHLRMRSKGTGRTKAETTEISNFKFEISDWGNDNGENNG
jgi:hypothetical protein